MCQRHENNSVGNIMPSTGHLENTVHAFIFLVYLTASSTVSSLRYKCIKNLHRVTNSYKPATGVIILWLVTTPGKMSSQSWQSTHHTSDWDTQASYSSQDTGIPLLLVGELDRNFSPPPHTHTWLLLLKTYRKERRKLQGTGRPRVTHTARPSK